MLRVMQLWEQEFDVNRRTFRCSSRRIAINRNIFISSHSRGMLITVVRLTIINTLRQS
jgi:hypothetical protein